MTVAFVLTEPSMYREEDDPILGVALSQDAADRFVAELEAKAKRLHQAKPIVEIHETEYLGGELMALSDEDLACLVHYTPHANGQGMSGYATDGKLHDRLVAELERRGAPA